MTHQGPKNPKRISIWDSVYHFGRKLRVQLEESTTETEHGGRETFEGRHLNLILASGISHSARWSHERVKVISLPSPFLSAAKSTEAPHLGSHRFSVFLLWVCALGVNRGHGATPGRSHSALPPREDCRPGGLAQAKVRSKCSTLSVIPLSASPLPFSPSHLHSSFNCLLFGTQVPAGLPRPPLWAHFLWPPPRPPSPAVRSRPRPPGSVHDLTSRPGHWLDQWGNVTCQAAGQPSSPKLVCRPEDGRASGHPIREARKRLWSRMPGFL